MPSSSQGQSIKKCQTTATTARALRKTASQSFLNDSSECNRSESLDGQPSLSDSSVEEIIIDDRGKIGSQFSRYKSQTFEDVGRKYPRGKSDREFFYREQAKRVSQPDMRAAAIKEFSKLDTSMLLKMEKEKILLQKHNLWEEQMLQCPVTCTIVENVTDAMAKCGKVNQTRRNNFFSNPNFGDGESVISINSVDSSNMSLD